MEKIKFNWGELIIVGTTNELSIGIDIILPGKETDSPNAYLKKGTGIYYVLEGKGLCGKAIKKGDLIKVIAGQKINLKNNSKGNLRVMTIYLPPYSEKNIGYKKD